MGGYADRVFVCVGLGEEALKQRITSECKSPRVHVNVLDCKELSTFILFSTYTSGDILLGVTINGKGCKLAARIKRELVACLTPIIGEIRDRVGEL